eukprot:gnl/Spiro4/21988_TR10798_c0_g1_i1.p1 gnl/Spiro4/21988_TR10798_c0_g1~~gnl/Spiro4/21988_TR10798_c0_g1_i1.p1  ORF type:complete len:253 (+),score=10.36 gnl/Spiro4/21988_TR10798_c0_g1_i1:35-793(+)
MGGIAQKLGRGKFVILHVSVAGKNVGTLKFLLDQENHPELCENFRALCSGDYIKDGKTLSFKNSRFYKITPHAVFGGTPALEASTSLSVESIYGRTFDYMPRSPPEKHNLRGQLSMVSANPNSDSPQRKFDTRFLITTQPAPEFDKIHIPFGMISPGDTTSHETLTRLAELAVDERGVPQTDARIGSSTDNFQFHKSFYLKVLGLGALAYLYPRVKERFESAKRKAIEKHRHEVKPTPASVLAQAPAKRQEK